MELINAKDEHGHDIRELPKGEFHGDKALDVIKTLLDMDVLRWMHAMEKFTLLTLIYEFGTTNVHADIANLKVEVLDSVFHKDRSGHYHIKAVLLGKWAGREVTIDTHYDSNVSIKEWHYGE